MTEFCVGLLISLWCHTSDIMCAPGFSCSALMVYACINNYCGVASCYYFVIPIFLLWSCMNCRPLLVSFSIPKLPNLWIVLGNSWDWEDFLVTSEDVCGDQSLLGVIAIFSVLSSQLAITGSFEHTSEYDRGLGCWPVWCCAIGWPAKLNL